MKGVIASVLTAAIVASGVAGAQPVGPPRGLTANGRLLWQFEALLRDVFGRREPYAPTSEIKMNFACAGNRCFPHARWEPYAYTFANAHNSSFTLKSRTFRSSAFGNYPLPLLVNGLYIACNRNATRFLTMVRGTAGFALYCELPIP